MTFRSLSLTFVLALGAVATGCSSQTPGMVGDDDGSGGDDGGGDDTPTPLDPTGTYKVGNQFDIATNAPGTVGDVVNDFIDMTDGANDPSDWLLTQIINQLDAGPIKSALQAAEPTVAGILNGELVNLAPDFVNTFKEVGQDFGDISKHFGLNSQLVVAKTPTDTAFVATHTFNGAHFHVENTDVDLKFSDYNVQDIVVSNLTVGIDLSGNFTVSENKVPVPYGSILRIGLDAAIIPLLDSTAHNLDDLLEHQVNCAAVGQAIADALGIGSATFYEGACHSGLQYGANFLYSEITKIDSSALTFDMTGAAKAVDTNADHKVDKLNTGTWAGTLVYGTSDPTALSQATFAGARQ